MIRAAVGYGTQHQQLKSSSSSSSSKPCSCKFHIDLENILGIVTLGSPHVHTPVGRIDITGGALKSINERFPGAYFKDHFFYVTTSGHAVRGVVPSTSSSSSSVSSPQRDFPRRRQQQKQRRLLLWWPQTLEEWAYHSYQLVSGRGKGAGDGIVPIRAAHLSGATQINLSDVVHSTLLVPSSLSSLKPSKRSMSKQEQEQEHKCHWYGSDVIVDQWFGTVLHHLWA